MIVRCPSCGCEFSLPLPGLDTDPYTGEPLVVEPPASAIVAKQEQGETLHEYAARIAAARRRQG